MFTHHARIYLHHTDAFGRLFFANQFLLVHEAKEHFMGSLGFPVSCLVDHPTITFPLLHAEADFKGVLVAGDEVDIRVGIEKLGETSVVFVFELLKSGVLVGTAKTVNVTVDKRSQQKITIPADWRKKLECGLLKP